jgi:serum amyloid A protein
MRDGESLVQQHANTGHFATPFKFNAKELDMETGNYYYGARYYNPSISVWLSVDAMAGNAQNLPLTPYHFSANNPVMIIDPDGNDWYTATGDNPGDPIWFDNDAAAQEHFGEGGFNNIGTEAFGFNPETGNNILYGNKGNMYEFSTMLSEVEVTGELTDHQRTMQNPIVQEMHKNQEVLVDHTFAYPLDFVAGVFDFNNAYIEMRDANHVNSDKYFHSKANYNASQRGPGGAKAAQYMSNLREILDQRIKGDSRQDAISDQKANLYGRNMGWKYRYNKKVDARSILTKYRPHNLPNRY